MSSQRYRPVPSIWSDRDCEDGYSWYSFLEEVLSKQDEKEQSDYLCSSEVVPAQSFYRAPFFEYMKFFKPGLKVEVPLEKDYAHVCSDVFYWYASVLKIVGYRFLLRFVGYNDDEGKNDFWVNVGSCDIRPIGFGAKHHKTHPPIRIAKRFENCNLLRQYLFKQLSISQSWPEIQYEVLNFSKFKVGERVELIDSVLSNQVRPAFIEKIIGNRLLIKVIADLLEGEDFDEDDAQIAEGVWLDDESPLFFYVGWSSKIGYKLLACDDYKKHSKRIGEALKAEKNTIPFYKDDTKPSQFINSISHEHPDGSSSNKWKKGMKLEILDPLEQYKELRVATILEILPDGFLKIGFDGNSLEEDIIPLHSSSPLLFPVGYSSKYGLKLSGPIKTGKKFDWDSYLIETESKPVPVSLFEPVPPAGDLEEKFKVGAKLEAVDMCESNLICCSTVVEIKGRLIRIHYDGWEDSYDQYFDYRSGNLYPLGWCEMIGYKLEAPKLPVKKRSRKRRFSSTDS